jgi:hypothetical protein
MDRGRSADGCSDRTCRRLLLVRLVNGLVRLVDGRVSRVDQRILVGSIRAPWAWRRRGRRRIQCSVRTSRRRVVRDGRHHIHVRLHDDDSRGAEGDRQRGVLDNV